MKNNEIPMPQICESSFTLKIGIQESTQQGFTSPFSPFCIIEKEFLPKPEKNLTLFGSMKCLTLRPQPDCQEFNIVTFNREDSTSQKSSPPSVMTGNQ